MDPGRTIQSLQGKEKTIYVRKSSSGKVGKGQGDRGGQERMGRVDRRNGVAHDGQCGLITGPEKGEVNRVLT